MNAKTLWLLKGEHICAGFYQKRISVVFSERFMVLVPSVGGRSARLGGSDGLLPFADDDRKSVFLHDLRPFLRNEAGKKMAVSFVPGDLRDRIDADVLQHLGVCVYPPRGLLFADRNDLRRMEPGKKDD